MIGVDFRCFITAAASSVFTTCTAFKPFITAE